MSGLVGARSAVVVAALLTCVGAPGAGLLPAVPAAAHPAVSDPAPAQPLADDLRFLELTVTSTTPTTVTSTSSVLTVSGTVTNIGDRGVADVVVRLQRAAAVRTSTELGGALRTTPGDFEAIGGFEDLTAMLSPGDSVDFRVSMPLVGADSLQVTRPGVYPVLVNVNGQPDFGDQARLDSGHFLLPVLGVPPSAGPAAPAPPVAPPPPVGMSVLWPLADRPRQLPVPAGSPELLSDDELATSFGPGGRLRGLLSAVQDATSAGADPGGRLRSGLCLAVDPDLLVTADAMTRGYQVRADDGTTTDGTGVAAATTWLAELRSTAGQSCVVALPWAQADLNALSRAGLGDVQADAVLDGAATVNRVLGVEPTPGLVVPGSGALTTLATDDLVQLGQTGVVLSAAAVSDEPAGVSAVRVVTDAGSEVAAALVDPATRAAVAATGAEPVLSVAPAGETGPVRVSTDPQPQRVLRLQDLVGALTWPALAARADQPEGGASAPGTVLVAPPQDWSVDAGEASTVLQAVDGLLDAGLVAPTTVPAMLDSAGAPGAARAQLDYPVEAPSGEAPTEVVAATNDELRALSAATEPDAQTGVNPTDLVDPLRMDLVRAVSGADPDPGRAEEVRALLDGLFGSVSLQTPRGVYTLASEQSPLLLVVRNDLPVAIEVRVRVDGPPGLEASDIGLQRLPAGSTVQLEVPTTILRSGQFSVDVALSTAGGQVLGDPTRVLVRSTAYGPATAAVTGVAGLVLLLLVARRLAHRFRGEPDRADDGRVGP